MPTIQHPRQHSHLFSGRLGPFQNPGFAGRVSVPNFPWILALTVSPAWQPDSFNPNSAGAGPLPARSVVFRIDHDEKIQPDNPSGNTTMEEGGRGSAQHAY